MPAHEQSVLCRRDIGGCYHTQSDDQKPIVMHARNNIIRQGFNLAEKDHSKEDDDPRQEATGFEG